MAPSNKNNSEQYFVGFDATDEPLHLQPKSLLRHLMALGSSGSGKTVFCKAVTEEFVRHGQPAICVDPQGDLCSLAMAAKNPELLASKGIDPAMAKAFSENVDVVVFTPASRKGIALSADPVKIKLEGLEARERVQAITGMASMLVALLGYDLGSDDGDGLVAVFDRAISDLVRSGRAPRNLDDFAAHLSTLDDESWERYERYLDRKRIDQACRRLARLDVGARRLLFHEGLPLDIDLLLGRGLHSGAMPGKTRLAIIYLNTLNSQEDKEFFVAALAEQLYGWMLAHPSKQPQALFYIDEVAPYIPPVRKPACKPALSLLFKQARKYGVCCVMATQNPGDVDYKAMAQFGTWAIGRLTTRQDMRKVEPMIKSLDPDNADALTEALPQFSAGRFALLSPDNFKSTRRISTRWLLTEHETLDDDAIRALTDGEIRARFDAIENARTGRSDETEVVSASTVPTLGAATSDVTPPTTGLRQVEAPVAVVSEPEPEVESEQEEELRELEHSARLLAKRKSMSVREYAGRADVGESTARRILKRLVAVNLAGEYKEKRTARYWALARGIRPDLGLTSAVKAIVHKVTRDEAEHIGRRARGRAVLGLFGDDEDYIGLELEYKVALRLGFREKVRRALWKRLFGPDDEERLGNIYLHPRRLAIVVYVPGEGMRLEQEPGEFASEIEDFDGVTDLKELLPGEIHFDEVDWRERRSDDDIKSWFESRFQATPTRIEPLFIPVWSLRLRRRTTAASVS